MNTRKLLVIIVFVLLKIQAYSQVEKYMAAFTYQICKSTTWPNQPTNFVIAMVGKSDIEPFFEQLAKEKKIGNQAIKLTQWDENNSDINYQVIFISKDKTNKLNELSIALKDKPILIITESSGTIEKGANLCFNIVDNKIRYDINKTDLLHRNIHVNSNIERMALKVY